MPHTTTRNVPMAMRPTNNPIDWSNGFTWKLLGEGSYLRFLNSPRLEMDSETAARIPALPSMATSFQGDEVKPVGAAGFEMCDVD